MTSPFPDWLQPMAATLTEERFTGSDWVFERKYDGIRLLATVQALMGQLLLLFGFYEIMRGSQVGAPEVEPSGEGDAATPPPPPEPKP